MAEQDRDQAIRAAVHERLLTRAASDPDFRRLLLDNPKSALARELGIDVPDTLHVTVLPETQNHLFIVIPPAFEGAEGQVVATGAARLADRTAAYGGSLVAVTGIERLSESIGIGNY